MFHWFHPCHETVDKLFIYAGLFEGSWAFVHPVYMCFVDLEKAFDHVPLGVLYSKCYCESRGYGDCSFDPCSPYVIKMRAVSVYLVTGWTHLRWMWGSIKVAPYLWSFLWYSWTGFQGAAEVKKCIRCGSLRIASLLRRKWCGSVGFFGQWPPAYIGTFYSRLWSSQHESQPSLRPKVLCQKKWGLPPLDGDWVAALSEEV